MILIESWLIRNLSIRTPPTLTFICKTGSPAIGAGTNLTSLGIAALNVDKDGNPRPAIEPWDIGAYQYSIGGQIQPQPNAATPHSMNWLLW